MSAPAYDRPPPSDETDHGSRRLVAPVAWPCWIAAHAPEGHAVPAAAGRRHVRAPARREFGAATRSHDPVHRARLRDAFLAAARDAHAELPVADGRRLRRPRRRPRARGARGPRPGRALVRAALRRPCGALTTTTSTPRPCRRRAGARRRLGRPHGASAPTAAKELRQFSTLGRARFPSPTRSSSSRCGSPCCA